MRGLGLLTGRPAADFVASVRRDRNDPGSFLWIVNNIFFQYYSLLIFLVCAAVMIGVSYATAPPSYDHISGLTYGTLSDDHRAESRSSWSKEDLLGSAAVLALILAAYLYFTG